MKIADIPTITFALSLVAILAFACTNTTTTTTSGGGSDAGPASMVPGETDDADASSSSAREDAGKTSTSCADTKDQKTCSECCVDQFPKGYDLYALAITQCVCNADHCETACGDTLCASTPKDADATCSACLQKYAVACSDESKKACDADPDCKALVACRTEAGCDQKN